LQITEDYVVRLGGNADAGSGGLGVYRPQPDGSFEHLANLVGGPNFYPSLLFATGNRVIVLGEDFGNVPYEFELPASFAVPPMVQDDFESGGASQWTPVAGSQFSIASNGTTQVYRQASTLGDAGAIHAADLTNQSISADIKPTAFNGNDRWSGLMTRYTDDSNYYYVTLRSSHRIVLKRMLNGEFTELASVLMPVHAGQTYHVRLDSSGSFHAVYLDGRRVAYAFDDELAHGRTGVRMYKAAADFDNVVITPGPRTSQVYSGRQTVGGTWSGTPTHFSQTANIPGAARLTSGTPAADQVVQVAISIQEFRPGGSPWVGLMARYVDSGNYYYATLRKSNELSLRKLTNGSITVLGNVPLTVTAPGAPILVRLEAVGDRLRVYVNGVLQIERAGAEVVAGKVGVMTYRARASFHAYTAYEP
jgi:hypothetical protein